MARDEEAARFLDARGCLGAGGIKMAARAAPGTLPLPVQAHLAQCGRCQDRLLAQDALPRQAREGGREPGSSLPLLAVLGAIGLVLAVLALLILTRLR